MPLFTVHCVTCGLPDKRLLPSADLLKHLKCRQTANCPGPMLRETAVPTLHNKEVIAQSHMLKPVERFTDAQKLYEERSKMDPRKPE